MYWSYCSLALSHRYVHKWRVLWLFCDNHHVIFQIHSPIARFMGPIWDPSGADRTQVGPMLVPWTLLSGTIMLEPSFKLNNWYYHDGCWWVPIRCQTISIHHTSYIQLKLQCHMNHFGLSPVSHGGSCDTEVHDTAFHIIAVCNITTVWNYFLWGWAILGYHSWICDLIN